MNQQTEYPREVGGLEDPDEDTDQGGSGGRKTPRERFLELAPKRIQRVLDAVHHLAKCSNRVTYSWEDEEVRKAFDAIEAEVKKARAKFENEKAEKFSF